ncbi:hypothetical protein CDIK_2343 [Cucumispora dikerogammari]|nr:hypothetical protein CDIK_2343 [Cucumispora dikerogammari]
MNKEGVSKENFKKFTCKNGVLFVNGGDVLNRYFCAHKIETAKSIIKSKHLPGHVGLNNLSKTIARDYSEISIKTIKGYIKRCLECNREIIAAQPSPSHQQFYLSFGNV